MTVTSPGISRTARLAKIIDLVQGGQGVFGIAIGGVWQEIEGTHAELPSERTAEDQAPSASDELAARRAARKIG